MVFFLAITVRIICLCLGTEFGASSFSAPEPKAHVHYCDHALSIVFPFVCPSVGNFHIFVFSSATAEWNSNIKMRQEANTQCPLPSLCCMTDRKSKMASLVSDWLRHFRLLLCNCWTEFKELNRKQDINVLYQVCAFWPIGKLRWLPWLLVGWYIFDFFSATTERTSMTLDRKQALNVFYQLCVVGPIGKSRWPPGLASNLLRHFRLFLWNCWIEFKETWQEARFLCPLQSFKLTWAEGLSELLS